MNSINLSPLESVNDLYFKACSELFAAYGLSLDLQDKDTSSTGKSGYISILSATGEELRLISALNIGSDLLTRIYPLSSDHVEQHQLEDWCSELNNQLVGRVKNKLLVLGCEVMIGLPSLLTGKDLSSVSNQEFDVHEYLFASAQGSLKAHLAMQIKPGLVFQENDQPEDQTVQLEGAHFLF